MAVRSAPRPAVFLDKDGTLVENVPHNVDPAKLRFMPGVIDGLRLLDASGFVLVVVTNQPGLALGYFDRHAWVRLTRALLERIQDEAGVAITDVMVCPHAAAPDGRPACLCRKPAPGLLRQAAGKHHLDLSQSWMVGDILDDVEAGRRAGCRSVLVDVGNETLWRMTPLRLPHHRAADLMDAARRISSGSDAGDAVAAAPLLPCSLQM